MGVILKLSDELANQIAAGEVVERPASVVKELLENALDAGATRITVAIEEGGVARIRVTDDGRGMDEGDATLSLQRHATSKLRAIDDLQRLDTFGFRGEALPSIASVARLTLTTRHREGTQAIEVRVIGGGPPEVRPAGSSPGTTVEVADLFFNVPARRKFLKSRGTEAAHVTEAVMLAALSRPDVSFFVERDGRSVKEWLRADGRRERASQIIPDERLEHCLGEREALRIEAYLGSPERARAGATGLYVLVNGRPVRDRQLARAVAQAYGSVLEPGRYPVGVLFVELSPEHVDVNVHPQKAEVRFADGRSVFDAVTRELHAGLSKAFALPAGPLFRRAPPSLAANSGPAFTAYGDGGRRPEAGGWLGELSSPSTEGSSGGAPSYARTHDHRAATDLRSFATPNGTTSFAPPANGTPAHEATGNGMTARDNRAFYASLQYIGQARGTFLLCEGADALYVLDQHAAAERVTFDRLRRAYAAIEVASQGLLVPEIIELGPGELATLEEHAADVRRLGLELRPVGATAVAVHAVPQLLAHVRPERLLRDVIAEQSRNAKRPFGDAADRILATMACHGSIRAGDRIAPEEARALLRALDEVDFAGHCPHGRPVVTRLSFGELEQRVGRA